MKKFYCLLIFCLVFSFLNAQQKQITRFAVVDTQRIYNTFKQDSKSVRDYEEKKQKYKNDIQVLANEIIELKKKKVEYQKKGNFAEASYIGEEITAKTSFLTEFSKAKNDELASIKQSLTNDDKFYASIYEIITKIAVTNGYSMVLSLQDGGAILWYSPTVDITQDVITELRKN
ncbi:MAG: OmpH family outer membrane protein [Treponema sp.]